jgi:hypothetical protein
VRRTVRPPTRRAPQTRRARHGRARQPHPHERASSVLRVQVEVSAVGTSCCYASSLLVGVDRRAGPGLGVVATVPECPVVPLPPAAVQSTNYKGDSPASTSLAPPVPRHGALRVPVRPRALRQHAGRSPAPTTARIRHYPLVSAVRSWLICSASALLQVSILRLPLALRQRAEARVPGAQFRPSTACSWARPLLPELAGAVPRAGARGTGRRTQPLFRPRACTLP